MLPVCTIGGHCGGRRHCFQRTWTKLGMWPGMSTRDSARFLWYRMDAGWEVKGSGLQARGSLLVLPPQVPPMLGVNLAGHCRCVIPFKPHSKPFIILQTEKLRLRKIKCPIQCHRAGFLTQTSFRNSDYKPPPDIRECGHHFRSSLKCRFLGFAPHRCIRSFKGGARKSVFNKLPT